MLRLKKNNQKCDRCGKGVTVGKNRPNSLHSTKRLFLPNLQKITLPGAASQILICTGCLRSLYKK